MAPTLTARQSEVLGWIANGWPEGMVDDHGNRISARSLANHGLAKISGRGDAWKVELTRAGVSLLAEAGREQAANKEKIKRLLARIEASGGTLCIPEDELEVDLNLLRAPNARYWAPSGKRFDVRHHHPDVVIRLEDDPTAEIVRKPVPVPQSPEKLNAVAHRFTEETRLHEVSEQSVGRCARIVHALTAEARRRGYTITKPTDRRLIVKIRGLQYALRLCEQGVAERGPWERERQRWVEAFSEDHPVVLSHGASYDADATGKLSIILYPGYSRWTDGKVRKVEDRLGDVLHKIEISAAEAEHRRKNAPREALDRQRAWEKTMASAKKRFVRDHRAKALRTEVAAFLEAKATAEYVAALESTYGDNPDTAEWIEWIRTYLDEHLEPKNPLETMPRMPMTPDITPETLRPYL